MDYFIAGKEDRAIAPRKWRGKSGHHRTGYLAISKGLRETGVRKVSQRLDRPAPGAIRARSEM